MRWQKIKSDFLFKSHNNYLLRCVVLADDGEMIDEYMNCVYFETDCELSHLKTKFDDPHAQITHIMLIDYPKN